MLVSVEGVAEISSTQPCPLRDLTAVRVSIVSLMISAAIFLLLGAVIAVQSESRAMAQWELGLRYVGLTGLTLCAISFLVSFLMARETEGEIRTWKAIAGASAYLFFVWLFAITAH